MFNCHGCSILKVSVSSEDVAKRLGKVCGDYFTISTGNLIDTVSGREIGNCLAEVLTPILAPFAQKRLLICGLGNPTHIGDSLGPATIDRLPACFMEKIDNEHTGRFDKLITCKPDVQNGTNIETAIPIAGIAASTHANCLLLIDSIAATNKSSICNNIQVSTAGGTKHCTGGEAVDWSVVGLPVVSIGIPLVLRAEVLDADSNLDNWFMPCHVGDAVEISAAIIAYALIKVSYPEYEEEKCMSLTRFNQENPIIW